MTRWLCKCVGEYKSQLFNKDLSHVLRQQFVHLDSRHEPRHVIKLPFTMKLTIVLSTLLAGVALAAPNGLLEERQSQTAVIDIPSLEL